MDPIKMNAISKIISGGQTGADQGALDFALECGIRAGGWCPKGRECETGIIPDKYPVVEVPGHEYHLRTKLNVRDSDGTLIIIRDGFMEEGTQLTLDYCDALVKTHFLVDLKEMSGQMDSVCSTLCDWIDNNQVSVLNVAGNRESNSPGIQQETKEFLKNVFSKLADNQETEC